MNLNALPIALLAQILSFEVGHGAIELWKCGDGLLNYKLSQGGVESVYLRDCNPLSSSRWPRALQHFRKLRVLTVVRTSRLDLPEVLRKQLQLLPPTLESLYLSFWDVPEAFLSDQAADFNLAQFFASTTESEDATPQTASSPASSPTTYMWDVAAAFPKLRSLHLYDISRPCSYCPFTTADFIHLPQSLQHMSFNLLKSAWQPNESTRYPPGLTALHLNRNAFTAPLLLTLPAGMTSIDYLAGNTFCETSLLAPCYDSLTSMRPLRGGVPPSSYTKPGWRWPPNLTTLTIMPDPSIMPPTLPDSLTFVMVLGIASAAFIRALPRTLATLDINILDHWSEVSRSDWPSLRRLALTSCPNFTINDFARLPRSLEKLDVILANRGGEYDDIAASCTMTIAQIEDEISGSAQSIKPAILDSIIKGWHFGLPLKLKSLRLLSSHHTGRTNLTIPPFLTDLKLGERFCNDFNLLAETLPPTITSISLSQINEPMESVAPFDLSAFNRLVTLTIHAEQVLITSALFKNVPESIRNLDVVCRPSYTLLLDDFSFLPSGLQMLRCALSFDLKSLVLDKSYIPPGDSIPFGWVSEMAHIPKWLGLLPRGLKVCDMSLIHARSDDLVNLPPTLRELRLAKVAETSALHFRDLPLSLRLLDANFIPTLQFMRNTGSTVDTRNLDEQSLFPPLLRDMKLGAAFKLLNDTRRTRIDRQLAEPLPPVDPRVVERYRSISSSPSTVQ